MGFFNRLVKLNTGNIPLEDFFTEIVAYLLSENQDVLYKWLKYINLLETHDYLEAYIYSQRTYSALHNHIYITRDFDPKDESEIFENLQNPTVHFKQLRWYQFHQFLITQADTFLIRETIDFMEENTMAHNNQFSSLDILTLTNFNNTLRLVDEIMWEARVKDRFESIFSIVYCLT
ncbi:MAG: hypothetical protein AB4041_07530 [Microcystaceae cyanobacterium]